ncbi:HAT dimerization [Cynara cardunculus var. scolymus]|uniref:HAT dimerization n=1 Tax=Cynara cardunculus var. scolymus TaxID=59895 RepID=A0A103XGZ9_CYNCS|nr:HAT dimerization [Cynara cardunculus var. scolymus]
MAMEVKVYCRRRKREKTQQIDHIPKCFQLPRSVSASKPRTDFSLPICSSKDRELELRISKEIQSSVIVESSDMSNDKIRHTDDLSSTRSTEPESRRQETLTNGMELTVTDKSFGKNAQIQPCSNRNGEDRDDTATVLEFTPNRSLLTENSEICATPGSVVWAKTGQCWWPAEVKFKLLQERNCCLPDRKESIISSYILGERSSKSQSSTVGFKRHLLVQYFGKNGSAWVDPATDLSPFEEALHYKEHPRSCKESSGSLDGHDHLNHHDQLPAETMNSTGPKMGSRKDPSWKYGVEIEVSGEGGKKVIWWDNFGDETPELKAFAIRILGLTCSIAVCERNWNKFNQMHTKRRNCLSMDKMNSLLYIMYNKKLKHRFLKKQSLKEEDDPLIIDEVSSDDEWIANPNDEEDVNSEVVSIEAGNGVEDACPSSSSRKRKERENSSSSSRAGTDCTGRVRSKRERKRKEVSCPLYTSRKVRRFKIMRSLGLAAPVGSPFNTP